MKTELCGNTFDAMGGVDVFDACNLEASSRSLAGDYGRVCEEVFPNLFTKVELLAKGGSNQHGKSQDEKKNPPEKRGRKTYSVPSVTVFCHHFFLVCYPVPIPAPQRC